MVSEPGRVRQPADGAGAACPRLPGKQGAGRAADAGPWHPGSPQAALQGHD